MDRNTLKTIITTLKPGDNFTVTFEPHNNMLDGTYRVIGARPGVGKGGSVIIDAANVENGESLLIPCVDGKTRPFGSAAFAEVATITAAGKTYGSSTGTLSAQLQSNKGLRQHYSETAKALYESFFPYIHRANLKIRIKSKNPQLDGDFTLQSVAKSRGSVKQLLVTLKDASGGTHYMKTYGDAPLIEDIQIDD